MSIWQIIRRLVPFIKPHRRWVALSLGLTLLGALAAQINPIVLRYTVDTIERLLSEGRTASQGASLLLLISAVLLAKEIINTGVRYGQNLFAEKIRVNVSSRLTQAAVERILTYRLAFYSAPDNQTGILQIRIDRGAESLTKLVQSAFIDILPLFASSILALVIMFLANVYVGLAAAAILPVYFLLSQRQASMLKGARRGLRALREEKNNNIIESIVLSLTGGFAGIVLGVLASVGVPLLLGWPTLVSTASIVGSALFSAGVGIFFGYYPARKAAGLDPIEALRYE